MFRSANNAATTAAQRARDEIGEAWEHLLAAAEQGARQAGASTRRQSAIARERAAAAALALRGEQPPSPWRWLAVGLAAGLAVGAAGAAVLNRRMQELDTEAVKQRAGAAVESFRERTGDVTHNAVSSARDTAGRITGRTSPPSPGAGEQADDSGDIPGDTTRQ